MTRTRPNTPSTAAQRRLDPDEAAEHLNRLNRLARGLCRSPHLAEDVVQETYARILAKPRFLRSDDDYSYLARTMRNVMANHMSAEARRGGPHLPIEELEPADPRRTGDPEAGVLASELYDVIAGLAEERRDVVAAVDVAGLSYAEAAEALSVPIGTVMSRLHRGRGDVAAALA